MAVADDVLATVAQWCADAPVAMATVTATSGSAARLPGAVMAVSTQGEVAGSVSSGCVEAAVFELAQETLRTGVPGLHRFGVSTDEVFDVGLTCGGEIEVFVQRLPGGSRSDVPIVADAVAAGRPVGVVTVVEHPDPSAIGARMVVTPDSDGSASAALGDGVTRTLAERASAMLSTGTDGEVACDVHGSRLGVGVRAFVRTWAPPPRLLIFGAVDFAGALAGAGRFLGYETTVCDARPTFTTAARFPQAHHVVVDRPHRYLDEEASAGRLDGRTVVCVLTHEARFDVPVLRRALSLPLGYVGAMGSRRTHVDRLRRLRDAGVTSAQLSRLRSPIGLDLGARTPEETALSIASELVADLRGGSGSRLSETSGPIHEGHGEAVQQPSNVVRFARA